MMPYPLFASDRFYPLPAHTYRSHRNSVPLSCACMGSMPDRWTPPTPTELTSFCPEVAMAYWLSKLLPLVLLPLRFSLILLVICLVGRWRWLLIMAALLFWIFSLGLVTPLRFRVPQADAIVVLSCHPAPGPALLST